MNFASIKNKDEEGSQAKACASGDGDRACVLCAPEGTTRRKRCCARLTGSNLHLEPAFCIFFPARVPFAE